MSPEELAKTLEIADGLPALFENKMLDAFDIAGLAAELRRLAARVAELEADNASLKTVMIAAAEEIHDHWEAHCDTKGYGPASLLRRLEEGIPSEYGYTAGAFSALKDRVAELEAVGEPVAYLYHDARTAHESHPWLNSTMVVMAADRRLGLLGETALFTRPAAPLTDEQIDAITDQQWGDHAKFTHAAHRAYARAVLDAAGITGSQT
jgi:hypothetical protein